MNNFFKPTPEFRKLQILLQLSIDPNISQKKIAKNVGIAVSMMNSYLKRLKKENIIRYSGENHKHTSYFLTEKGELKKRELLYEYMNETIGIYKKAKKEFNTVIENILKDGVKKIILYGAAETCEIVINSARETGIEIKGIIDENKKKQKKFLSGIKISSPDILKENDFDAVCITSYGYRNEIYEKIKYLKEKNIKIYIV